MQFSVGKPILAMVSVACIAVPAGTLDAAAAASTGPSVRIAAATPTAAAPLAPGVDTSLLDVLTFPYHNAYGIAVGVGTAANAGLQLALLPVSIAGFVAVNKTGQIPAYIQTVQTNLANAIPGIIKAIQTEIEYDRNLFGQLGGGSNAPLALASDANVTAAATGVSLLNLLTFPYHNAYGIAVGFGTAANAVLQLALLPVSIAGFVAVNKTNLIPAYVQTVQTNLANAIPGIIKAIQTEIEYDRNLFSQLGGGTTATPNAQLAVASVDEPRSLTTGATATDAKDADTSTDGAAEGDTAEDEKNSSAVKPVDDSPAPKPAEGLPDTAADTNSDKDITAADDDTASGSVATKPAEEPADKPATKPADADSDDSTSTDKNDSATSKDTGSDGGDSAGKADSDGSESDQ